MKVAIYDCCGEGCAFQDYLFLDDGDSVPIRPCGNCSIILATRVFREGEFESSHIPVYIQERIKMVL